MLSTIMRQINLEGGSPPTIEWVEYFDSPTWLGDGPDDIIGTSDPVTTDATGAYFFGRRIVTPSFAGYKVERIEKRSLIDGSLIWAIEGSQWWVIF